ncbi:DUF1294 domain-containing protein [Denitrificimonas sp. JX-1]|uniref:DUF1294 domain-containing protein n=1 Tax=Denitrificimonas halotolerans TaxID=3098930 RepID=A0ABU5GX00_9GAMM|nr:DUF1294 domain-containing protein [Denitrificimonas sp. JX-1]MDY7220168.1 DUF1294 domain-containing protein [Denitrificimonas sp. JX-1]
MEQSGTLSTWNDAKGYGFIRDQQGRDHFVHISNVHGNQRPQPGEQVVFIPGTDKKGRLRVQSMRSLGPVSANTAQRKQRPLAARNLKKSLSLVLLTSLAPLLGAWHMFQQHALLWPLLLYIGMSLLAILMYWRDKNAAQKGKWRVPEQQLHLIEMLGGWPGALLAQQLFRHKTQKISFQVIFWLIVAVHQAYWIDQLGFSGELLSNLL